MLFFLERYWRALAAQRRWLPVVLLLPLFYLAVAAARQDLFTIEQVFRTEENPPPAWQSVVRDPTEWLLAEQALGALERRLQHRQMAPNAELGRLLRTTLSLGRNERGQPWLRYTGFNPAVGEVLVEFFSQRLVTEFAFVPEGAPRRIAQRAWWREYRLLPAVSLFVISLGAFLVLVALRELLDPSFKSERQIARYLGLPVLGTLPNVDLLLAHPSFFPDREA